MILTFIPGFLGGRPIREQSTRLLLRASPSPLERPRIPLWSRNLLQGLGLIASPDGIPVMREMNLFAGRPTDYLNLICSLAEQLGPVFKAIVGPKAIIVVTDPAATRTILKDRAEDFDKGLLSEVLDEIMGSGLIPAQVAIWKRRRKEIAPAFHKAWIERMVQTMDACAEESMTNLGKGSGSSPVDLEAVFGQIALDIIGKAVFNYDFQSRKRQDSIVQAVYEVMQEAEHRAMFLIPYWKTPLRAVVSRQVRFDENMSLIESTLNRMILEALKTRSPSDIASLEQRDYSSIENPSLLRFLVDLQGADVSEKQLKDDLMTLLIAGHETTAAVVTWTAFELMRNPKWLCEVREEVDRVLGDQPVTIGLIRSMPKLRNVLAESMRLYPQPALLIRRAIRDTMIPVSPNDPDGDQHMAPITEGSDIFIVTYALHRSEKRWKHANIFNPDRWNQSIPGDSRGWEGYDASSGKSLYPTENQADFAFIPFGGGQRKCVGDQFGFLESAIIAARLIRAFDFQLAVPESEIGLTTGATIHTEHGLPTILIPRQRTQVQQDPFFAEQKPE
mmetsp:Transcript_14204/g.29062  ORF Transcript_14204/g.29062 Transcript_14204/m.29062 type:complete len:560 (-) Transcript_14204:475-2154(-)